MPLPDFHVSESFTLGIELEMQVVNPPGYDLSQDSSMLIDAVKNKITAGEVKHDITESMLELATDVCRDINQAAGQFSAMQKVVLQAATDHHLEICGGGTHPFQKWQRQEVCDNERYQRTLENFGYLIQQATVFGQHVHVGCASGDDAIYLLHGLSRFVPHFIALSAASPYMQGTDTRFASSRPNIFSAFPDNGPMPWVSNWQQFEALFRCLSYTTMIDSIKDLHWDIRPSPHFGTVEVRVMDTPLTLSHAVNMAGLIQATAHWLLTERPFKHQEKDYLLYKFNRFQACRYGLEGVITDPHTGDRRPLTEDTLRLLEKIAPSAHKIGASSAIEALHRQVASGLNEAQLMRDFVADGGSLIGLVKKHCEIWAGD
ncbi:TPA: glutamate--cysteine ligase [Escherichia coli]|uniref:YbdK family carboxylate-amine ligase n=1 Tax=Escherichia coli TaxID=562 RepID=UPI00045B5BF3|nr:YbdK family carboxylate-amine ligase [Escherichia coli]EFA4168535.1 glutamate--cysteine ligase [Escherichia coli O80:H45]EGM7109252.1 glutamate--cysteine ligase [Escherichia coli]EGT2340219.1 glutamate--cysteine ligase [Escherichia coli]EIA0228454.1 glutamate--cysteine ligase [Escherichia coli]MBE4675674.1 glutamate--cysteine ligase [Escherichia coli]